MTRRGSWLSGRVATWMDRIKSGYSAKKADSFKEQKAVEGFAGFFKCWKDLLRS
jgi:hypothetical protein